ESVANSLIEYGDALQHLARMGIGGADVARTNLDLGEKYSRQSLEMRKRLLGGENPKVANAIHHLANVLSEQGKVEEAEALQRQALAMYRELFGENCPEVAKALSDMASLISSRGDR